MSDRELIHLINTGDNEALSILLDRHLQKIFQACFRVCLDEDQANDITQNIVIKIIKNLKKFQAKSEFSTWYYRIAYNESIAFLKKQDAHIDVDIVADFIPDEREDFSRIDDKQQRDDITKAINTLPLLDRNIILYFYFDDLKIKQIARILSLNENTVKTRLKRAKQKLKPYLKIYEDINTKL